MVPTIMALRKKMDDILQGEWKKAGPALQGLKPEQQKAMEIMTSAIINKVLHDPITFLKQQDHKDLKDEKIDWIQKVFKINKGMEED